MPGGSGEPTSTLAPLLADPGRGAVLLDLDGTLAPIVARPEDAAIAPAVREALRAIAGCYGLTAIVSGRRASVAREIAGVDEIAYAGNHGFEVLLPGDAEATVALALSGHADEAPELARALDSEELERAGVVWEDKGPIVALHWRRSEDVRSAERLVERIAATAARRGLVTHAGRMVLELRPPVAIDKGVAIAGLLAGTGVRAALYAGDDRTDLDAFRELARRRDAGDLDAIVRVGVRSDEGPGEIVSEADLVVDGPAGMPAVLEALAG